MNKLNLALFCSLLLALTAAAQENIRPIQLWGIPALRQKDDMACWITVYTMMKSWKDKKVYSTEYVAEALGQPWLDYYRQNTGLPPDQDKQFMARTGLKAEPPASYMLTAYADWLQKYGPVWVVTGNLGGRHARLLTGIDGDGTYDRTDFIFVDPSSGTQVRENARKFFDKYEQEARLANVYDWELQLQLFHF